MSANDLADALDRHAAELDDAAEYWNAECDDMRAAAALLREQAEQLDTLRNERAEAVEAWEQMKAPLGAAEPFMRLDRIMQDWAAAGGGVPEEGATDE